MRKTKFFCVIIMMAMLLGGLPIHAYTVDGDDSYYALTGINDPNVPARQTSAAAPEMNLDAVAVILVEKVTGEVLYEKNADAIRPVASITKIMTMILVAEAIESGAISLDDPVTCSEHAYSMGGSQIWLEPGEIMTVDELLRAVAVASANDAAVALAEHVSGGEPVFVVEMNRKAAELGMFNTTFHNANGLDEDGHVSSARDVALMSREILRHDIIREYITIWQDELRGGETDLTNTNKLVRFFPGITGIKTGTTSKAGVCVSASAERDGMELIAVVLGSSNSEGRFDAARDLLEYGFANYELAAVQLDSNDFVPVRVKLGVAPTCAYEYNIPAVVLVDRGKGDTVSYMVELAESQTAPIEHGQTIGEITVYSEGIVIGRYPITAKTRIERMSFGAGFKLLLDSLLRI